MAVCPLPLLLYFLSRPPLSSLLTPRLHSYLFSRPLFPVPTQDVGRRKGLDLLDVHDSELRRRRVRRV